MSGISQEEKENLIDELFSNADASSAYDSPENILETPTLVIDLDDVNGIAEQQARIITERLSNYYFDQKYIDEHPYIPSKIMQEMDNIRRLLKMLTINEKAQDVIITSISMNAAKGTLYQNLTSLQTSMLNIQTQLNKLVSELENIFKEMQAECDKTFAEKPKEQAEDGSFITRGSKEFIEALNKQLYANKLKENPEKEEIPEGVDPETGEILNESEYIEGEATYSDIVAI